jgi:hypothetical protein
MGYGWVQQAPAAAAAGALDKERSEILWLISGDGFGLPVPPVFVAKGMTRDPAKGPSFFFVEREPNFGSAGL